MEALGAIATAVAAVAAVVGVWVAWSQLGNLNSTLRMNALAIVLQLESEMNSRKAKGDELAAEIRKVTIEPHPNQRLVEILGDHLKGCLESWLNAVDRLAFCILREYVPEKDWKTEYRNYIADMIRVHKEYFGPDTIYTNIIDLHHKWQRS